MGFSEDSTSTKLRVGGSHLPYALHVFSILEGVSLRFPRQLQGLTALDSCLALIEYQIDPVSDKHSRLLPLENKVSQCEVADRYFRI